MCFPTKYKSSESRVLYLTGKKGYGTLSAMADDLGVARQFITECLQYSLPHRYAGYLGRKFSFCPSILCYGYYVQILSAPWDYKDLVNDTSFFSTKEKQYILSGSYIENRKQYVKTIDNGIGK